MSTAAELLATLHAQGFVLVAEGDRIRVGPATLLTAELRDLIRAHRLELLAVLYPTTSTLVHVDLPADPAALQARLDALTSEPVWARCWAERLRPATWADLDAVRRTVQLIVDLAAERHRAGDLAGFRAWCRFTLDLAAGKHWDEAARRPKALPADPEGFGRADAVATR